LADPETFAPTTELLDMEGWDSMGMVMFISLVEESHGLKLSIADLRDCTTAQGLCDEIEARFPGQGT
jgi:acyl carrier protein